MKNDFEDLSALARRRQLSELEARKLDNLLEASSEARFWHSLGSKCDTEETSNSDERDATERVVTRLLQGLPRKRAPIQRYRFLLVAAALLLVVSASAAAIVSARRSQESSKAPALKRPPVATLKAQPEPALPQATSPVLKPGPSNLVPAVPPAAARQRSDTAAAPSASELLSAAGQARRRGDATQAIHFLDSLQARFPNSPEARASDIALGKLKLQTGAARSALAHFERYLKRSSRGELAPEAIWGRAQAMSALGNQTEAQRSLTELVQRYPNSPYASSAKAKLRASGSK